MMEPEENEFLFNGMNLENREVFRLREIRRKNKKLAAAINSDT